MLRFGDRQCKRRRGAADLAKRSRVHCARVGGEFRSVAVRRWSREVSVVEREQCTDECSAILP